MPCSIPATSAGNIIGKMAGTTKNCYKAPLRSSISATTAGTLRGSVATAGSLQLPGRRNFHRHSRPGPAKRPLEASKVAPGRCRLASAGAEGERRSLATSSSCEPLLQQATSAAASYGPNLLSRHFWPAIAAGARQALAAWTGRANPADSSPRLLHLRLDQGIRLVLALVPLHAGEVAPVAKQQLRGNEHPSGQPCKATGVAARAA